MGAVVVGEVASVCDGDEVVPPTPIAPPTVMIDEDETELAVRVLHTAYGLDAEDEDAA